MNETTEPGAGPPKITRSGGAGQRWKWAIRLAAVLVGLVGMTAGAGLRESGAVAIGWALSLAALAVVFVVLFVWSP